MRFSVGAVNVRTGNFVYFDTTTHRIGPRARHGEQRAAAAFPSVEIDGEHYWDGGIVSNTPLQLGSGIRSAARIRSPFRSISGVRAATVPAQHGPTS